MNILNKVLSDIQFAIPQEVLIEAFRDTDNNWRQNNMVPLEQKIMNKVIKPRVMMDANIVSGEIGLISLEDIPPKYRDQYAITYEIPADRTLNREIISVLSVSYMPYTNSVGAAGIGYAAMGPLYGGDLTTSAQKLGESYSSIPNVSNASANLVGYNTVSIIDPLRASSSYLIRCYLTNDNYLNNINPRSMFTFGQLCVLAVKSYIYKTLLIRLDRAYIQGGQELGSIKSYVEGLSDTEEQYQTYLKEVWTKTALMNNHYQYERLIRMQVPIGL